MADVSRLVLTHPALGTTGGAGLHASIEAIYAKIGNNISTRILTAVGLANAATATVEHSMKTAFEEFRYDLYLYNTVTLALTRVTSATSPSLSQFTIIANVTNPTTHIDITNNSGATRDLALVLIVDPLFLKEGDIKDVDITTTPPGDGEALVWNSAGSKFKPGASGDASFKVQSVATDGTIVVKGGYLIGDDGIEYATYDGAGTASTDYGTDLSFDLDTLVLSPVNSTTYYLYVDKTLLSASVTLSDNGRQLIGITGSHFVAVTTAPKVMLLDRYIPIGFVRYATAAWSATIFGTLAFRRHQSTSAAVINYILESDFENGATSGWATYLDAAGVVPVDGTAGSPVSTFASSSSSPLRGTHSGLFTKGAANRQGEGFSCAFTIAAADKSLPLSISWEGLASAAYTGSTGTEYMSVYVYDVTNSVLITPSSTIVAQGSSKGKCFFLASTSTSYRLIFHVAGAGTSAWTYQIDSVSVGPQTFLSGFAGQDRKLEAGFTPNNFGTVSDQKIYFSRVGDMMHVSGVFTVGSGVASPASISLPTGLVIDSTKFAAATNTQLVGRWDLISSSTINIYFAGNNGIIFYDGSDTAKVYFAYQTISGAFVKNNGNSVFSAVPLAISFSVPIVGWSSNVTLADRALEEYASLAGTWDASDTTASGTVSGPAGSVMGGALAAARTKRIVWQNPRQATDNIFVEIDQLATGTWQQVPISGFADSPSSVNDFGVACKPVSGQASQTDVVFSRYRTTATTAWDSTARWRVRKVSGGTVGFPVSSTNIVGRTDGLAPSAGYVGEILTATPAGISQNSPTNGTFYDDSGTLTLTPGNWLLYSGMSVQISNPGSISGSIVPLLTAAIRTGSTTLQKAYASAGQVNGVVTSASVTLILPANISTSTTYKLSILWEPNSGSPTVGSIALLAAGSFFYAVRIA